MTFSAFVAGVRDGKWRERRDDNRRDDNSYPYMASKLTDAGGECYNMYKKVFRLFSASSKVLFQL